MHEMQSLNLNALDVEELEQRLELQTDAAAEPNCDCWSNSCSSYCNQPKSASTG